MNAVGQRTAVSQTGTAFASSRSQAWGYNARGEVVKADSSITGHDRAYEYDGIGNRTKAADSLSLPGTNNYEVNALNQYTKVGTITTAYDGDGNATSYPVPKHLAANSTLVWDAENRLITATVNGTTSSYLYDAQGRRFAVTTGSTTGIWIYDGWNPIGEYGRTGGGTPALAKTYTWGLDLSGSLQGAGGVGGLLSVTEISPTVHFYPTYDGNGNVTQYLNASGGVEARYEYDPFGRILTDDGDKKGDFAHRFSTKPLDGPTGLYYYGYRYYDPVTGRWPSRDPIEEQGGINLYGFVGNDGTNKWDYLGTYTINDAWKKLVADGVEPTGPLDTLMEGPGTNRRRYSSQQLFDAWHALEKTSGAWWEVLPKCPKKLCLKNRNPVNPDESKWKDPKKPSSPEALLHPGTKWSMRSKPVNGHSNQCTYADTTDNKSVNLIADAPGAGTVDYKNPGFNKDHFNHDVDPVLRAAQADGQNKTLTSGLLAATTNVLKHYEVRPLH